MKRRHRFRFASFRHIYTMFGSALDGQRGKIAGALALIVSATLVELLKPWPAKFVVDRILLVDGAVTTRRVVLVMAAAVAAALIPIIYARLNYAATILAAKVGKTATARIRRRVFEHMHRLSIPFHTSSHTGDLLVRLTGDVNMMRDLLFGSWLNLVARGLLFGGISVVLVLLDPMIALAAVAPMPMIWISLGQRSKELKLAVRRQRRQQGNLAAYAGESLSQIHVVKAYAAEDFAVDGFEESNRSGERQGLKAAKIAARMQLTTEQLTGIGGALVLGFAALRVMSGDISVGTLLVAVSYSRSLYKPLRKMSTEMGRLAKATAIGERLTEVLSLEPERNDAGAPAPRFQGHVTFEDVDFAYDDGSGVLTGATFEIGAGQIAALMGPNGAGKSTIMALLLRLFEPASGRITIDGASAADYQLDSYRRRIAYVPQGVQLFAGTIRDNIRYGRLDAGDEDIERAAALVHLDSVIARLPDGYDTELGEGGATLSGGEARRVMLARAAVRDADILLLDEPLAGLDPQARPAVAAAIAAVARGRTTIVVTHLFLDEVRPDLVFHVVDGRVVARPSTDLDAAAAAPIAELRRIRDALA